MAEAANVPIEFQRLHGMGEALYEAATRGSNTVVLRAYAPVGGHEDLLPYLVRRLLENGANTSFVHALLDENVPAPTSSPIRSAAWKGARPAPPHPTPRNVYGDRPNSMGVDLSSTAERERLVAAVQRLDGERLSAGPIVNGAVTAGGPRRSGGQSGRPCASPGRVARSHPQDIDAGLPLRPVGPARVGRGGRAGARAHPPRHGRLRSNATWTG
jgi:RHH-type proline utilization regulon transcriptional repressor/proline dehydrogenase/delta 1-pyrroline-5-carboxylate dehydrogenase